MHGIRVTGASLNAARLQLQHRSDPVASEPAALGVDGLFSDFADTAVAARVLFKLVDTPGFARCFTEGLDKFQHAQNADCFDLK